MNETVINGIIEESQEVTGQFQYARGAKGDDGIGISDISKTSTEGKVDTYTITLTDGTTKIFTVTNGDDGANGISVSDASINASGHLIVTLSDGTSIDAGAARGDTGIVVDSELSSTSENPVQNKVANAALNNKMDKNNPTGTGSFSLNRMADTTVGDYSFAEGYNTKASGSYSHAEGLNTQTGAKAFTILGVDKTNKTYTLDSTEGLTVGDIYSAHVLYTTGASSQAENYGKITAINGNIVTVDKLWCEGDFATSDSYISGGYDGEKNTFRIISKPNIGTRVIADVSHAEGVSTKALSKGSHSEGKGTIAYGSWSHAEGNNTKAGYSSHAEGNNTTSSGFNSHAEGEKTTSSGFNSHAEGVRTVSSGFASHAEGSDTKASDTGSHSEGFKTIASGFASHAEGKNTESSGANSHAEGSNTVAVGSNSHAEGNGTKASGSYSHSEGFYTKASDSNSHAEGNSTTASGYASHAEGNNTKASGANSHAEGFNAKTSGYVSHAEGNSTTASSSYQHVQGKYNIEDTANTYADIIGNGSSDTERSNAATVDWDGNAWYAGDVYIGSTSGTNKDEGSKKLATEKVVLEAVTTEQKRANSTFANALKGSKSGSALLIDDVSPVTRDMGVKVSSKNLWQNTNTRFPSALSYNSSTQTYTTGTGTTGFDFIAHKFTNPIPVGTTVTISIMFQSGKGRSVSIGGYHRTGGTSWQGNIDVPGNVDMTGQTLTNTFTTTKTVEEFMVFHNTGDNIEDPFIFKVQYELGTTATSYAPYVPDLTAVKVSRYGKNLLNLQGRTDAQPTGNWPISKYDVGHVIYRGFAYTGYYQLSEDYKCDVNVDGSTITVIQKVNNYGVGYLVKCRPNTQYTFSATMDLNGFFIGCIDKDGNKLDGFYNKTFTTTSDTEYIIICLYNTTAGTFTVENPQLELGSTATDYEPYKECEEYTPAADGTVNGVTSLYPNTTLITDTDGVIIDCEYNRDINKAFAALEAAIATNNS